MSFSEEKDESCRDGELRRHPFWISGESNEGSEYSGMVKAEMDNEEV